MSAPRVAAVDLETARMIKSDAVAALGPLSVGMVSDLLADRTSWTLTHCHAAAHALAPSERCARAACEFQPTGGF